MWGLLSPVNVMGFGAGRAFPMACILRGVAQQYLPTGLQILPMWNSYNFV